MSFKNSKTWIIQLIYWCGCSFKFHLRLDLGCLYQRQQWRLHRIDPFSQFSVCTCLSTNHITGLDEGVIWVIFFVIVSAFLTCDSFWRFMIIAKMLVDSVFFPQLDVSNVIVVITIIVIAQLRCPAALKYLFWSTPDTPSCLPFL